ncbi:diacylglyceryl transferase [Capnocytophaga stomatis]|uniref:Diacylglyceryl transferase n=1 Tax=Capnocytophaga stomatis TaxID=1848904 RepID=A0A250FZ75_9FLAO|nr:prolipoprotein diacylglyceryl transferase family protein [Capnocytophaga stomatis]ATA89755.1 diacylglyceryl transferase [Capnocytophaga stomatis]
MKTTLKILFQKIIYASTFCIFLPLFLIFWAKQTENIIKLPVPSLPVIDLVLVFLGLFLIIIAMSNLWFKGKGLPMNAFPPKKYVSSGAYYFFHHPIYVGAVLMCLGISLYFKSASGLWLISPIFILLIWAYLKGFENEIISSNFSNQSHRTFFDFPEENSDSLSLKNRLLIYIWIFLIWFLLYEAFIFLGTPPDAISTRVFLDDLIPFLDFSVVFYVLSYPLTLAIPLILKDNKTTRIFIFDSILGMGIIFYCYLVFPFIVPYTDIENRSFFTNLIILGRETDGQTAALPSFHVFWAMIFYKYFSLRFPKISFLFAFISFLIIISCLTTYSHTILDVIFGIISYYIVHYRTFIYKKMLFVCEKISNSWKEWHFGNIRVINHGFYAALGGISGFLIIGYFFPEQLFIVYLIGISGFVGAGLWAQFIESSSGLSRPFGYYGSLIGIGITLVLISLFSEIDFWKLMGVSALAASSIQFFGRFRCLVQGCCHGKPTETTLGICFHHPKSRVHKMANLSGKNLYPTQFYSIVTNFLTFFFLFRLVTLQMSASFIIGMYLILNGSFRFVEESLRGEPQTPYFMGMRVYQWLAMASVIIGILCTCAHSLPLELGELNMEIILHSLLYGFLVLFAYGIDFPKSNKRFSRLE